MPCPSPLVDFNKIISSIYKIYQDEGQGRTVRFFGNSLDISAYSPFLLTPPGEEKGERKFLGPNSG
jgi:hypothetical protein